MLRSISPWERAPFPENKGSCTACPHAPDRSFPCLFWPLASFPRLTAVVPISNRLGTGQRWQRAGHRSGRNVFSMPLDQSRAKKLFVYAEDCRRHVFSSIFQLALRCLSLQPGLIIPMSMDTGWRSTGRSTAGTWHLPGQPCGSSAVAVVVVVLSMCSRSSPYPSKLRCSQPPEQLHIPEGLGCLCEDHSYGTFMVTVGAWIDPTVLVWFPSFLCLGEGWQPLLDGSWGWFCVVPLGWLLGVTWSISILTYPLLISLRSLSHCHHVTCEIKDKIWTWRNAKYNLFL